jgi:type II secretory ATPase GspE/PulE/Tfp pilus assembly ATPase PilB-like protein
LPAGQQIYRAKGCDGCDHTGFRGRTGIYELLVLDDELRRAIGDGISQQELVEKARSKGWRSYREEGVAKILDGVTTVEEVLQAG